MYSQNFTTFHSEILRNVQKFLRARDDWTLCKTNKQMYSMGPLRSHVDYLLIGEKPNWDNFQVIEEYIHWIRYCIAPEKSPSLTVQKLATMIEIRYLSTKHNLFSASGTIALEPHETIMYVRKPESATATAIDFSKPLSQESMEFILQSGSPAAFGMGSKTVVDTGYRKAIAIPPSEFAVNLHRVLPLILRQITDLFGIQSGVEIQAHLYKMNVYEKDGFFKSHVDTPRGSNMIGSLVVALPISHTGGKLIVRQDGMEQGYSFEPIYGRKTLSWAAFYSDCEHEILPVTSGLRVTLTFNLLTCTIQPTQGLQIATNPYFNLLSKLFKNRDFMEHGGEIAFGLKFDYPFDRGDNFRNLPLDQLKGVDLQIHLATEQLRLQTKLNAVYYVDKGRYERDSDESSDDWREIEEEDFDASKVSEVSLSFGKTDFEKRTMLTEVLFCESGDMEDDRELHQILREELHAFEDRDLVWMTYPKNEFKAYQYIRYGNEASLSTEYAKVALIVKIPPFENRRYV
ncbi:hypothetical protein HK098_001042 [Nowakowskiella sp. JEL0407]|nr:hypothetical protein HK098_001042 [Nowakowskiella sp. JEL0407]